MTRISEPIGVNPGRTNSAELVPGRLKNALKAAGFDPHAAEQLLPLVYDELRTLAAARARPSRVSVVHEPCVMMVL